MTRQRRRRKKLSLFTVIGVLVFCAVLCGTMAFRTATLRAQSAKYSEQISELKREQKRLEEEKAELKDYQSYVKTEEYMEEIARERLGLVYPNEIIFEPDEK